LKERSVELAVRKSQEGQIDTCLAHWLLLKKWKNKALPSEP